MGEHGGAVVVHRRARQPPLRDCLGQAVDDVFGVLRQIPLHVAAQTRAVVEDRERNRGVPVAGGVGDLAALALMAVVVPDCVDVGGLEAADLQQKAASSTIG